LNARRRLCAALAAALLVVGCAAGRPAAHLTLFVAASLTDALAAAASDYVASHAGVTFTQSTGSSTALRTQIEQGAPADVLLSADTANPAALAAADLSSGPPLTFASNRLAIVVPRGNPARLSSPADLARPGLRVVAAGEGVPITAYASQLVANLAALPGAPANLIAAYAANVVSREDDVRAVLAKVELGEADAGIVYATDAAASAAVETIPIPAAAQVRVEYGGVVVRGATNDALAHDFLDWLAGPAGAATLARFGFGAP
jgi:molybdate transport system substrate-binding protein